MKVYVVTAGSYSDYDICGIFSTQHKAQEYMDRCRKSSVCWRKDFNEIEFYELNDALRKCEYYRWSVGIMLDDGSLEGGREPSKAKCWGIPESKHYIAENVPAHKGRGTVRAESHKSAKHALKIATEARRA